jgi:hypothetical protein
MYDTRHPFSCKIRKVTKNKRADNAGLGLDLHLVPPYYEAVRLPDILPDEYSLAGDCRIQLFLLDLSIRMQCLTAERVVSQKLICYI